MYTLFYIRTNKTKIKLSCETNKTHKKTHTQLAILRQKQIHNITVLCMFSHFLDSMLNIFLKVQCMLPQAENIYWRYSARPTFSMTELHMRA